MSVHEFSSYSRIQKETQKSADCLGFAINLGLLTSSIDFSAWLYIFIFYPAINTNGYTSLCEARGKAGWPTSVSTTHGSIWWDDNSDSWWQSPCLWNFLGFRSHELYSAVHFLAADSALFSLAFSPSKYYKPSVLTVGWLLSSVPWSHNSVEAIFTSGHADRSSVIENTVLKWNWLEFDALNLI